MYRLLATPPHPLRRTESPPLGASKTIDEQNTAIDKRRATAIRKTQSTLSRQSQEILGIALTATTNRLASGPDSATQQRLTQRLADIDRIKTYLSENPKIEFLGIMGWGADCQIKVPPNQGLSEFDTIVYRKNGKLYTEKIGSCWQLYTLNEKKFNALEMSKVASITEGGHAKRQLTDIKASSHSFFNTNYCFESDYIPTKKPEDSCECCKGHVEEPDTLYCGVTSTPSDGKKYKSDTLPSSLSPLYPNPGSKKTSLILNPCREECCSHLHTRPPADENTQFLHHNEEKTPSKLVTTTEEGCPCCANGVDLDELAGIGKETSAIDEHSGHGYDFEWTTEPTPEWGIVSGVSAPFAIVGLTAAYRNIRGSLKTRKQISQKITEVNEMIEQNDTPQLRAYKYCLEYSLCDSYWNIAVPGGLNGISSGAVLSTVVATSPLALPALAAYGGAQACRSAYDFSRANNPTTESPKINQITRSKKGFFALNGFGFMGVAVGAVLVCLAPLTFGATLIPGLAILIPSTIGTGIINNIWPKKFRPRNGDIGVKRETLTEQKCISSIETIREQKTAIKQFKKKYMPSTPWLTMRRVFAKIATALPFLEKRGTRWAHDCSKEQFRRSSTNITMHISRLRTELAELGEDHVAGMNDEYLLTQHLKTLRYHQYGINDFYWGLRNTADKNPVGQSNI